MKLLVQAEGAVCDWFGWRLGRNLAFSGRANTREIMPAFDEDDDSSVDHLGHVFLNSFLSHDDLLAPECTRSS